MSRFGFLRVAAATPRVRPADVAFNLEQTLAVLGQTEAAGADVVVLPELGLTGYTCHDLFHQTTLLDAAEAALVKLLEASTRSDFGLVAVGLPVRSGSRLINAMAVLKDGKLLGVVPKSYLPTYNEFYEARYFAPASAAVVTTILLSGQTAPFGTDLLFAADGFSAAVIGVEICEDLWMPLPPSSFQATAGAIILLNASAGNELIGKAEYRRQLVVTQSARCAAAYVYASAGVGESTTDLVFGGQNLIAENGVVLAESKRFQRDNQFIVADVDAEKLERERFRIHSFHGNGAYPECRKAFRIIPFSVLGRNHTGTLLRHVEAHPFVPNDAATLQDRCEEIFHTQTAALAKRLEHIGKPSVAIGVSGGLDSTLALLVTAKVFDLLGVPRENILGFTMPGYGTTNRTFGNALQLMAHLGTTSRTADIRSASLAMLNSIGHKPFGIAIGDLSVEAFVEALLANSNRPSSDLTFENVQARVRTSILMNAGFTIGTGDLSETALGWCTYNADHMSMYNPNSGIPKTLVKFLVRWAAEHEFDGEERKTLIDITETEISPELLPTTGDGRTTQSTQSVVGPYELHDFFLYHTVRFGASPAKILFLASRAKFDEPFTPAEIHRWLEVFVRRFFNNQFKRSALPDGPKVGSVSLSPRGDWRMPSDAVVSAWLADLEEPRTK